MDKKEELLEDRIQQTNGEVEDAEPVMMDLEWIAVYKDQTNLHQYDESGEKKEKAYSDIDRENLSEFHVIDRATGRTIFAMAFDPGQRLIYRKRHAVRGDGTKLWTILMVGWQQTIKGVNVQSIAWIFPDGSIIQTGKFNEHHRIFYGVEMLDFENVEVK